MLCSITLTCKKSWDSVDYLFSSLKPQWAKELMGVRQRKLTKRLCFLGGKGLVKGTFAQRRIHSDVKRYTTEHLLFTWRSCILCGRLHMALAADPFSLTHSQTQHRKHAQKHRPQCSLYHNNTSNVNCLSYIVSYLMLYMWFMYEKLHFVCS